MTVNKTTNLKLSKPDGDELVDVTVINSNMDAIDTAIKSLQDRAQGIIPVKGTGTTEGVWTGASDNITAYYEGLTIAYFINIPGGSKATTLNINDLGTVPVYRDAGALTTHLPVNTVVLLTYSTMSGSPKWHWADYDSNNYAYVRYYNLTKDTYNKDYYLAVNNTAEDALAAGSNGNRYCGHSTLVKLNPYTGNVTAPTFTGDLVGNAATATRLANAVNVSVKDSDGSNTGASVSLRGDADVTVPLPSTIKASLTGHASLDQTRILYNDKQDGAESGSVAVMPVQPVGSGSTPIYIDENGEFKACDDVLAGGVSWSDVTGRPTKVSEFTNDANYATKGDVSGLKENVDDLLDRVGDLEGSMGEVSGDVATEIQALKGGKADKATTLAGYGITDAKIADGVITLGSNTITPLTSHQSLGSYLTISEASNTYQPKGNYLTEHQSLDDYATKDDLTSAVTGLYKIKGSITALPESPEVGDVYNLANALSVSILGAKAATIPAGSNIVYTDNGWDKLSETYSYSLPLATSSKRGGVKVGYVTNADSRNYAVQLDSEMMYVNVPWKDYGDATESGPGLMTKDMVSKLNGIEDSANHYVHPTSGVTAGTYNLVKVDANGHVTAGESKGYATVSGSEALTNKTYNGYTLGAACSKGVTTLGSSGPCGYSGTSANVLVAQSALAFWDGRYNDTGTNLRYAASPSANGDAQSGNGKAPKPIATTDWAQHKVDYKTSVPSSTEGSQNDVVVVADTESVGSTSEPIYKENGVLKKCTAISSALATKTTTTLSPNEPASSSDGDIWFCIEA